jgi:hypothetical protein
VENNLGASRSVLLTSPDMRYESSGSVFAAEGEEIEHRSTRVLRMKTDVFFLESQKPEASKADADGVRNLTIIKIR